eukprot:403367598
MATFPLWSRQNRYMQIPDNLRKPKRGKEIFDQQSSGIQKRNSKFRVESSQVHDSKSYNSNGKFNGKSYPTKFDRDEQDNGDNYQLKVKGPDVLATTFTFRQERYQGTKYALSWIAILFIGLSLLPLVAIDWIDVFIAIVILILVFFAQLVAIIYQNNKHIFTTKFAQTNMSFYINFLHKNAISFDEMNLVDSSQLLPKKVIATIRFFSENHPFIFFGSILAILIFSILTPVLVDEGCLTKYDEYSSNFLVNDKYGFSSKFLRSFDEGSCKGSLSQEPCHVYTTASEPDPSQNFIINFHLAKDTCGSYDCSPYITYWKIGSTNQSYVLQKEAFRIRHAYFDHYGEYKAQRKIYRVYLENLEPGRRRMSNNYESVQMDQILGSFDIDLALISGYLVFDYGQKTCFHLWDRFLKNWQYNFISSQGSLIASIIAPSKSELGFQPFTLTNENSLKENVFLTFFPQKFYQPNEKIKRLYHLHKIGDQLSIYTLDPGYLDSFAPKSQQTLWLKANLLNDSSPIKIFHFNDHLAARNKEEVKVFQQNLRFLYQTLNSIQNIKKSNQDIKQTDQTQNSTQDFKDKYLIFSEYMFKLEQSTDRIILLENGIWGMKDAERSVWLLTFNQENVNLQMINDQKQVIKEIIVQYFI